MKINEIITDELLERYQSRIRHAVVRRTVPRPIIRSIATPKPVPGPKSLPKPKPLLNPFKKSLVAPSQTKGINPNKDITKGPDFKLDQFNPIHPMTDIEKKIYRLDKGNNW